MAQKEIEEEKVKEKQEVPLNLLQIESPFAQDTDFVEFADTSNFWIKQKSKTALDNTDIQGAQKDANSDEDDSYGDEDDSSDDDAEELMREYEKLKREREEEKRLKELAKMEEIRRR